MKKVSGQCLCGAVQFSLQPKNNQLSSCHCSICRRQAGGVNLNIEIVADSLVFSAQQALKYYDSSAWGERAFCSDCGTHLFWRSKDQQYCNVNPFILAELPEDTYLATEIYIDNKPDYYTFAGQRQQLTEADIIAMFSPQTDA
ncbi:GFA family protein [Acinetobacter larvae]|uniref:S-(Hydroxymethyl)glutathione synthase n=1 Tax=Acinetobacter larvae TaxID=1789224 RepID=A0A1B2M0C7_9GAMM|nr:GFA family protein [Acinetobacter larvae]AOA58642.1 S-(hydroxymethyl)glutathione synthase [Acinetobacter larvae]